MGGVKDVRNERREEERREEEIEKMIGRTKFV